MRLERREVITMNGFFSWFRKVDKVKFVSVEGHSLTFKTQKVYQVGDQPVISIAIPVSTGGAEDFRLPVTIRTVRVVGPKAVVCVGDVPGAAESVEQLRELLHSLDPKTGEVISAQAAADVDATRRAPRYNWSIRVLSKDLVGFRAISLDFNRLGLKLSTEGPSELGKIINMTLEIETANTRELLCQGVVRWCKEVNRTTYEVGVEFTELDPEVAQELENFERFLATRETNDVARRQALDAVYYETENFGPGVDKKQAEEPSEDPDATGTQEETPATPTS